MAGRHLMIARVIAITLLLGSLQEACAQAAKAPTDEALPRRPRCSVYEADAHVGELASVRGMVREVLRSRRGLAVLTFGGCYPDQVFSVVIADPRGFGNLKRYHGSTIEVAGLVRRFGGKPEIVISRSTQILRMEPASDPTQGGMGGP